MAGVAIKPDGTPYQFAQALCFIVCAWNEVMANIPKSYVERAGGEFTNYNANAVIEAQIAIFEDLLATRPDGILVVALDSTLLVPVAERCADAGIPIFNYDILINTDKVAAKVTSDQLYCGHLAGRWLAQKAEATGKPIKALEAWGTPGMEGCQRRHQGFVDGCAESDLVTRYGEGIDCGWMPEPAMNAVLDAFPADPALNAIFSHGGDMPSGMHQALRQLGREYLVDDPNHVYSVHVGDEPPTLALIANGYLDAVAVHSPWEITDVLTKIMLANVCCGQPIPWKDIVIKAELITAENILEPRYGYQYTWGELPIEDWDNWPVLDMSEYMYTPTVAMKEPGYHRY